MLSFLCRSALAAGTFKFLFPDDDDDSAKAKKNDDYAGEDVEKGENADSSAPSSPSADDSA